MPRSAPRLDPLTLLVGAGTGLLLARLATPHMPRASGHHETRAAARHRVVVVGAGFGGLSAALRLARRPDVDLTLIDTHNHHLFQPLLYQVATAALSPEDIAAPVRGLLPATERTRVLMRSISGIDAVNRRVLCDEEVVPYDELIIATGSKPSYFGHGEWAKAAPGLKTLDDALDLRRRILGALERASDAEDMAEQARLLTFVLIGGGPTGVEMAGSIAELTSDMLARDYELPTRPRILLVEAGKRVLAEFAPDLSQHAADALTRLGVEILTGRPVKQLEPGAVHLGDETIAAETIIWTAGTEATPVAEWLGVSPAKGGRVAVGPDLAVDGHPHIYVIGDAALALGPDGKPFPALAPVAKQQGAYVARAIMRRLRGRRAPAPFAYQDYGTLATIGRNKAVAEFGRLHLSGFPAWVVWAVAHIFFLISFRNRVMVSAQWAFAYATHQRSGRLIIDAAPRA